MPQIGGHQQVQFKSAHNAYQGIGSSSMSNLHTGAGGHSIGPVGPKFSHNYSSQTPNAGARLLNNPTGNSLSTSKPLNSQSHAQMTTQSSSPAPHAPHSQQFVTAMAQKQVLRQHHNSSVNKTGGSQIRLRQQ